MTIDFETEAPPEERRSSLWYALVAAAIVFIIWNVPQLGFILYPFRLFVTFIHEAGHSVMAVFTGGSVVGFEVFSNGTGLATTRGGNMLFILPAGYLGAAFFGAALFYLVNRAHVTRLIGLVLGTFIILVSFYLRATNIALVVGVISGVGLIALSLKASLGVNLLVLNILAIITGLNAVLDLVYLASNSSVALGTVLNDAAAFSRMFAPFIPAAVWAVIWAGMALAMMGAAIWYGVVRPLGDDR
jgi:hypothetical protein